jgi:hypothetical protein
MADDRWWRVSVNLHRIFSQPQSEKRGRFNDEKFYSLVSSRILALGGVLLSCATLALLMVLVRGQHSQERKIDHLAQQVGTKSSEDLESRRLEVRTFIIRRQLAQAMSPIVIIGDSITEAALMPSPYAATISSTRGSAV